MLVAVDVLDKVHDHFQSLGTFELKLCCGANELPFVEC